MKKRGLCLLWIVGWLLATMLFTGILLFALTRSSFRVVHTWSQPDTISYQSFDPYYLSVVEGDFDWRGFPFNVTRRYFIYIGVGAEPAYGYMLDYSFHNGTQTLEEYLRKATVEWSSDGVAFQEPSGQILFIPKEMFIGGR